MRVLLICLIVAAMATINGAQAQSNCTYSEFSPYQCTTTALSMQTNVSLSGCENFCCYYGNDCRFFQYEYLNTGGDGKGTCSVYTNCNSAPGTSDFTVGTKENSARKSNKLFNQLSLPKRA